MTPETQHARAGYRRPRFTDPTAAAAVPPAPPAPSASAGVPGAPVPPAPPAPPAPPHWATVDWPPNAAAPAPPAPPAYPPIRRPLHHLEAPATAAGAPGTAAGAPGTAAVAPATAAAREAAAAPTTAAAAGKVETSREARSIVKVIPLLVVLVCVVAGIYLSWRQGSSGGGLGGVVGGGALLVAAAVRLALPARLVGLLATRKRVTDVLTLASFGVGLVVAGLVLPH